MSQIPVTVKIDANLKKDAQKLAKRLGLSLSAIVENKLREAVIERRIVFEEPLIPNKQTAERLLEIEEDIKAGHNISGPFETAEDMLASLEA